MTILLNNISVDTDSSAIDFTGGFAVAVVRGDNYGGGTVNIQARSKNDSGSRWATLTNGAFTSNGTKKIDALLPGLEVRAQLTGSTGASNVFVEILYG